MQPVGWRDSLVAAACRARLPIALLVFDCRIRVLMLATFSGGCGDDPFGSRLTEAHLVEHGADENELAQETEPRSQ